MDARRAHPAETLRAAEVATGDGIEEALEFVRFCRHRKHVAWPELYDEMCAVAARRAFRDWGFAELADHGIGFTLWEMPHLATLVARVVHEERAARARAGAGAG